MNANFVLESVMKLKNDNLTPAGVLVLEELEQKCIEEIRLSVAKKNGSTVQLKALQRVLKACMRDVRPALQGTWFDSEDRQCVCDGFQAYRLREHFDVEVLPNNVLPVDLTRIFPRSFNDNFNQEIVLPSREELLVYIKLEKARKKSINDKSGVTYDFGDPLPLVNAEYLLNAIELLSDCKAFYFPKMKCIYFVCESGDGFVLQVRRKGC